MRTKLDLTVIGNEIEINELLFILRKIEWCGNIGASRTLPIHVDGDGSGRLHFYVKQVPKEEQGKKVDPSWIEEYEPLSERVLLNEKEMDSIAYGNDFKTHWIGE